MNLASLIKNIRVFLHDPDGDRWTDEEILTQINLGIANAARYTRYYRETKELPVVHTGSFLALPNRVITLLSIKYNDCEIIDRCSPLCKANEPKGSNRAINAKGTNYNEINILNRPPETTQYTLLPNLGVISENLGISDDDIDTPNTLNGVASNIQIRNKITITYIAVPKPLDITGLTQEQIVNIELPIPDAFIEMLQHYACAFFLRSDRDSQSRGLGNEEYKLFLADRNLLKQYASSNFEAGIRTFKPISRRLG